MEKQNDDQASSHSAVLPTNIASENACPRTCQICNGRLIEIRAKLVCERCHTIWETCCEGGRG